MDWTILWTLFWTILSKWEAHHQHPGRGGIQSISTEEGWEAECYHSGRGERLIIITQGGGVGGGCNSKRFWLMKLLVDYINYFNRFFGWLFVCQNFCAGPRRFFLFLSCAYETAILTLELNCYWKYRFYDPSLLSYACGFWVDLCIISCFTFSFIYSVYNY